ncbi:unnamed protein product [Arabidopsis lyrata]|uniref:Replication protein A 70 kDa DNA-binding subunit B/D first OB fold domain-containing protein n=1 Tax=Arabidopsis lyrata subsp. lyrata TaxID=81972 RepID=D7LY23_ARALL|nr:hypothetical protein ARALYDRAFT_352097 [Arabidopsis lyrata subsp. lyrata]CAH8272808.1 unnamed protein product [Arabidopsis lyrata]
MATNIHSSGKKKSDRRDIFVDVSELNPMSIVRRIKVKILRIFESCTLFYETLELILVDAKGHKIRAIIPRDVGYRFPKTLIEGNWMALKHYDIVPSSIGIRLTTHEYEIQWLSSTIPSKIKSLSSGDYFSFVSFEAINNGFFDLDISYDLIGRVLSVGSDAEGNTINIDGKEIYFELENDNCERLRCRLPWFYVSKFLAEWSQCNDDIIICIFRFARTEISEGTRRVTASYTCSQILLNHSCHDVTKMRGIFVNKNHRQMSHIQL